MVDVTRRNFDELLPEIRAHIQESSFVAIDTEFTGLHVDGSTGNSLFDTPDTRYQKLKQLATQYTISQIGLCIFVSDRKKNSYEGHTYNFYLFPRSCSNIDVRFSCQASSIEFLVQHKFDFNKFFYDGISYLNNDQEKILKEQATIDLARDVNEDLLQHCHTEIAQWVPNSLEGDRLQLQANVSDRFESLRLQTMLRDYFPDIWTTSSASGQIIVSKVSEDSRKHLESAEEDSLSCHRPTRARLRSASDTTLLAIQSFIKIWKLLNCALGFTKLFRILVESKKPLVGHNMLTDLVLIYEKFYQTLPEKFSVFKQTIHELFPCLIDTKHLSFVAKKELVERGLPITLTSLDQLYQHLSSQKGKFLVLHSPSISIAQHRPNKYRDKHPLHEAGYDAYLCGYVFLRLAHYLAARDISALNSAPLDFSACLFAVKPYTSNMNIIRANVPYINFAGSDPPSRRPELLYVSALGMTSRLNATELAYTFGVYSSVDIRLVDHRHALLAVSTHGGYKDIIRAFKNHKTYKVDRYNMFQHSRPVRYTIWGAIAFMGAVCVWTFLGEKSKGR